MNTKAINASDDAITTSIDIASDACKFGKFEKFKEILRCERKISINAFDRDGVTFLHWAAINDRLQIAEYLIELGADVSLPGGVLNEIPLQWAIRQGHLTMVNQLIKNGSCLNHTNIYGQNCLHIACQLCKIEIALLLLSYGVPVNSKDSKDQTPLMYSIQYNGYCVALQRVLASYGSAEEINAADNADGNTPLHMAVIGKYGHKLFYDLIKYGADVSLKNKMGFTAEKLATSKGMLRAAGFLKSVRNYPSSPNQIPFQKGFLVFPVLFTAVVLSIHFCGWDGIPVSFIICLMFRPCLLKFNGFQPHRLAYGITFWSILMIWFTFDFYFIFEMEMGLAVISQASALLLMFLLVRTKNSDPGFVEMSKSFRDLEVKRLVEEGDVEAFSTKNFCHSCINVRRPRVKHCEICNKCVNGFDHHCPFVNNCVGLENRRLFLMFLLVAVFASVLFIHKCLQWVEIEGNSWAYWIVFKEIFKKSRIVGCVLILDFYIFAWAGLLLITQFVLVATDKTTYECIKKRKWVRKPTSNRPIRFINRFVPKMCRNCWIFWTESKVEWNEEYELVSVDERRCADQKCTKRHSAVQNRLVEHV